MRILDTSALLAYFLIDDPDHSRVVSSLDSTDLRVVSPFVLAELDYLVATRFGARAEAAVLDELAGGRFELPTMTSSDIITCRRIIEVYDDLGLGLTDASLVVLADRYGTEVIVTLDRRHFSALRGLDGQPFTLLP